MGMRLRCAFCGDSGAMLASLAAPYDLQAVVEERRALSLYSEFAGVMFQSLAGTPPPARLIVAAGPQAQRPGGPQGSAPLLQVARHGTRANASVAAKDVDSLEYPPPARPVDDAGEKEAIEWARSLRQAEPQEVRACLHLHLNPYTAARPTHTYYAMRSVVPNQKDPPGFTGSLTDFMTAGR